MIYLDAKNEVLRILEDPQQGVFAGLMISRAMTRAVRRVANAVGDEGRLYLSFVESQQSYILSPGIRRINKVRVIPENSEMAGRPLTQVMLHDLPENPNNETDPTHFALTTTSGANEDQFNLVFWPTPGRSAVDAVVIDYEIDSEITGLDDNQPIPFPPQYDYVIINLTCSILLSELEDESEQRRAAYLRRIAEDELRDVSPMDAISSYVNIERQFP